MHSSLSLLWLIKTRRLWGANGPSEQSENNFNLQEIFSNDFHKVLTHSWILKQTTKKRCLIPFKINEICAMFFQKAFYSQETDFFSWCHRRQLIYLNILWYNFNFEKAGSRAMFPSGKAKYVLLPSRSSWVSPVYITAGKCYLTWEHCLMIDNNSCYNSLVFQNRI